MEQFIINADSIQALNKGIRNMIEQGYIPVGSHVVVVTNEHIKLSGTSKVGSYFEHEYSQCFKKGF